MTNRPVSSAWQSSFSLLAAFRSLAPALTLALTMALLDCGGGSSPVDTVVPFYFDEHIQQSEAQYDEVQFRSFRPSGELTGTVTLSGGVGGSSADTRRSLTPPVPSRFTFEVLVPDNALLQFAIGVLNFGSSTLPASVEFLVRVADGTEEETCFDEMVRRFQPDEWVDQEVDLSRWSGKKVRLTFETKAHLRMGPATSARSTMQPLWGNPALVSRSHRPDRPNVVLISIDCLRADHIGAYGYERNTTPRIDELAKDGVVFETLVSTAPWTFPSHMSMLTGLPPSIHGATRWSKLHDSVPYLSELLAQAGYRTDGTVSVDYISQDFGFERGFHSYYFSFDPGATRVVDHAIDLLRKGSGQNQFLFVHTLDVHWPYWPPEEFRTRFGPRPLEVTELLQKVLVDDPPANQQEIDHVINLYDGELAYVDQELGRLFDEMKSLGTYDSSLIVLTADHGEAFYEHGFWKHTQTLYDEMIHIPLIVKWPKGAPTGRVEAMVSQTDVFPTILGSSRGGVIQRMVSERSETSGPISSEPGLAKGRQ